MKSLQQIRSLGVALLLLLAFSFKVSGQQSPPPFIEILQPNDPGVEWVIGSEVLIAWNHNFVFDVKVELWDYTDFSNPDSTMINPSVVGTTTSWFIDPAVFIPGNYYKIRVTSNILNTPDTRAESDHYFSLVTTAGGDIMVEQPNVPNIKWLHGTQQLISWDTDLQENVKIELYSDTPWNVAFDEADNYGGTWNHGDNYGTGFGPWAITSGTDGTGGIAEYDIGDPADGNMNMDAPAFRIHAHSAASDTDNFVFADREFLDPLAVNQRFVLDWSVYFRSGNPGKGFILYSDGIGGIEEIKIHHEMVPACGACILINGDVMFNELGTETMTTYFEYEEEGVLRVYGVGRDGTETYDETFAVSGAPDAIRFFAQGIETHPINPDFRALYFNNLRIETNYYLIAASVPSSTYYWDIPAGFRLGDDYKIKVSSTADPAIFDFSDHYFSIVATLGGDIEVLQPVEDDYWLRDNQYLISWIDDVAEPLNVHLWKNDSWHSDIQNNVIGSTLVWSIDISHDTGDDFQIRVFSSIDGSIEAFSGYFEIGDVLPGGEITVLQPNEAGIYWMEGNSYLISWIDNIAEPVDIDLMQADGVTLEDNLFTNLTGSTKIWNIPTGEYSGHYKIRVKSSAVPNDVYDVSDNTFEIGILPEDVFILMHQPNVAGITWLRGTQNLISWSHNIWPDGEVNIYLERDGNPGFQEPLASNLTGSTWVWDIPVTTGIYDDYRIRVSSADDPAVSVTSAETFSISNFLPGGELEVLQPNGGEEWLMGHAYLISWIGNYTGNVNVYLYKDGDEVDEIAMNVSGSTVVYTVPDNNPSITSDSDYKVYIENVLDPTVYDYSDGYFSILATAGGTVEVLNPEAGDIWFIGHQYFISWIDDLQENVDIYLYKTGAELELIASDVPGSTYIWTIPAHLTLDTDYQVRVQSSIDPVYYGESGLFEITLQVLANVYPNPANNQFTVQFTEQADEVYELELTNRMGIKIHQTTVNASANKQAVISTHNLPEGVYFLQIRSANVHITKKVIIKR